jgi:glycosyltransferase involved in cell wall biosynthesis
MKKTILVDGHCIDDIAQGSVTYITELYKALDNPNVEVLFCNHSENKFDKYFGSHSNIKFVPVKAESRMKRYAELNQLVEKYKADFLHFQYTAPFKKNCKWINTLHDILFLEMREYFPMRYILPRAVAFWLAAKRSDIIITGSEYSKASIQSYFNIPETRVKSIGYGAPVFPNAHESVEQLKGKNFFLYVSRIEPRKNHIDLIKAFELYLKGGNDSYLVLVGAKSILPAEFNEIANKLGSRLIMLEGISEGQLNWLYCSCKGHIYPSLGEGFGFPVLESLSLGTPTASAINTSLSAFSSLVDFKLEPLDVNTIARSFEFLNTLNHSDIRAGKTLSQYNWANHADEFSKVILAEN